MGICQEDYQDWFSNDRGGLDINKIEQLISQRLDAKKNKDFDKADAIRQELLEMSIEIKDTESGTDWNFKK
jgi:cysteinyl-tRNA synthetase